MILTPDMCEYPLPAWHCDFCTSYAPRCTLVMLVIPIVIFLYFCCFLLYINITLQWMGRYYFLLGTPCTYFPDLWYNPWCSYYIGLLFWYHSWNIITRIFPIYSVVIVYTQVHQLSPEFPKNLALLYLFQYISQTISVG